MKFIIGIVSFMLNCLVLNCQIEDNWNLVYWGVSESAPIVHSWQDADLSTHIINREGSNLFLNYITVGATGSLENEYFHYFPDSLKMLSYKGIDHDPSNNIYISGLGQFGPLDYQEVVVQYSSELIAQWEYLLPDTATLISNGISNDNDTTIVSMTTAHGFLFIGLNAYGEIIETPFTYTAEYFTAPDLIAFSENHIVMGIVSDSLLKVNIFDKYGQFHNTETFVVEEFSGLIPLTVNFDENESFYFELIGYDNEDSVSQIVMRVNKDASLHWIRSAALHADDLYATLHARIYLDTDQSLISNVITQTNGDSVFIHMIRYDTLGSVIKEHKFNASDLLDPDLSATSAYCTSNDIMYVYFPRMQTTDHAGVISVACNSDWIRTDTLTIAFSEALAQCFAFVDEENVLTLVNLKTEIGPLRNVEVSQFTDLKAAFPQLVDPTSIGVFPNPCDAFVICNLTGLDPKEKAIAISDLAGRTVLELQEVESNMININTAQLASGVYLMNIGGKDFNHAVTLVKR